VSAGKKQGLAITASPPSFTTAQAQAQASKFTLISTWTTYFQLGAHNGFGANIWIPATAINDQVVQPGQTFNFWNAVGPVTQAKGYTMGGAIINGHTQEGAALGGGICATSTTLFNAALRAGFQMGERSNHYYYVNRYPVGLDATVSVNGNSVQNVTWTNDSPNPVLIKAFNGPGSVTFSLYGVPTGRTVSFSQPIITNYTTSATQVIHTSALPGGQQVQVEYADDGFDSSVTRTVRDASGAIVHQETYYSNYATMTGLVYVGDPKAKNIPIPVYGP
jgi:vancomycin resistance protein YoaR